MNIIILTIIKVDGAYFGYCGLTLFKKGLNNKNSTYEI